MDLSLSEIIVVIIFVIIVFGPKKIPEIARGLGDGIRTLKNATDDIKREILKEADDINPQEKIKTEISSISKTLKETKDEIDEIIGPIKRK